MENILNIDINNVLEYNKISDIPEENFNKNILKEDPQYYFPYRFGKFMGLEIYYNDRTIKKISPPSNIKNIDAMYTYCDNYDSMYIYMKGDYITQSGMNYIESIHDILYDIDYDNINSVKLSINRYIENNRILTNKIINYTMPVNKILTPCFEFSSYYPGPDGVHDIYAILCINLKPYLK